MAGHCNTGHSAYCRCIREGLFSVLNLIQYSHVLKAPFAFPVPVEVEADRGDAAGLELIGEPADDKIIL